MNDQMTAQREGFADAPPASDEPTVVPEPDAPAATDAVDADLDDMDFLLEEIENRIAPLA